jgi:hypothetical protein
VSPRRRPRRADMVADGVFIALGAARQAVKNHLIVKALRDRADFDRDAYLAAAAVELGLLAAENDAAAERVGHQIADARGRHGRALHPDDFRAGDRRQLRRRRRVLREVATRLREVADDPQQIEWLLDSARDLALIEIQATTAAAFAPRRAGVDPVDRAAALAEVRAELADLHAERTGY